MTGFNGKVPQNQRTAKHRTNDNLNDMNRVDCIEIVNSVLQNKSANKTQQKIYT